MGGLSCCSLWLLHMMPMSGFGAERAAVSLQARCFSVHTLASLRQQGGSVSAGTCHAEGEARALTLTLLPAGGSCSLEDPSLSCRRSVPCSCSCLAFWRG